MTRWGSRIQALQVSKPGGLPGPCSPDPATFVVNRLQLQPTTEHAATPKFKCCTPPYGGEQEEKRGQAALPVEGHSRRLHPRLTAEPLSSFGDVQTVIVERLPVRRYDPTVLRSGVLCGALERVHCDPYPQPYQPCFRTHRRALKTNWRYD